MYQPDESPLYTSPTPSPSGSPSMYDASVPMLTLTPLTRSSLQTIAEENNDVNEQAKKKLTGEASKDCFSTN
ncbi:hypothetical protein Btru_066002 [Bulinus truncatus]|nr:hypothetical protein Btru_066002 [Bulinus truncatus]